MKTEITIIAGNAGGITLQIEQGDNVWQHLYDGNRMDECATDIRKAQSGDDITAWDGDESGDGWQDPSDDEIRNGGCRVLTVGDVEDCGALESWGNVRDLRDALAAKS